MHTHTCVYTYVVNRLLSGNLLHLVHEKAVYTHTYTHTHTHTHIYIYIYIHTYTAKFSPRAYMYSTFTYMHEKNTCSIFMYNTCTCQTDMKIARK